MSTTNAKTETPGLDIRHEGGICRIGINNPARRNALTLAMWRELGTQVDLANKDDAIRAVLIYGVGGQSFASGADISEFKTQRSTPEQIKHYDQAISHTQQSLSQCEKPTVALIQGICMGGGMGIAAACDLRYANDSARFRMPAGLMGLGYSLDGIARMADIMGAARTSDIFLTARIFDGLEAARIGFVQESFPDLEFETQTQTRLESLAGNAPLTLKAARMALQHLLGRAGCPNEKQAQEAIQACFGSDDYVEGRTAFREKRKPVFKGR